MYKQNTTQNTAQALTLEGIVASMIVISVALVFSVQVLTINPFQTETTEQHIADQQASNAESLLQTAEREELIQTVLYWNTSNQQFYNTNPDNTYDINPPDTKFGNDIETYLQEQNTQVTIQLLYPNQTGELQTHQFLNSGTSNGKPRTVERTLTVYDSTRLYDESGQRTPQTLTQTNLYLTNQNPTTQFYSTVTIRMIVWNI